jgi:hypothetical protein
MKNITNFDEYSQLNEKQSITNENLAKIRSLKSHTEIWNSLVKWYDKAINRTNMHEIAILLRTAADEIDNASFDEMK